MIEALAGPDALLFWPGVVAGLAIAIQCGVLGVFVALKRLAFMGQGVSHAALGGVGIATALGLTSTPALGVAAAFCVATALGIAAATRRGGLAADTAIGVFLVGSMALGAALISWSTQAGARRGVTPGWESLLFGSMVSVTPADALLAWIVAAVVVASVWLARRPLLFWAVDETSAEAFGVPTGRVRAGLMVLLALTIVVSMKLAGVVLTTALLVLPGAAAARLSARLAAVFALSIGGAILGVGVGLAAAFETGLPAGSSIVLTLIVWLILASATGAFLRR